MTATLFDETPFLVETTDGETIQERWLPIPDFPSHEVSDLGNVRHAKSGRILNPPVGDRGYRMVSLYRDARCFKRTVHSLVLAAFVGPRPPRMDARHLDGDSLNNALVNLRYGTRSENILDQVRHGTHARAAQTACKHGHPFDATNTRISRTTGRRICRKCDHAAKRRWLNKVRVGGSPLASDSG
jgi:hypothetical protein